MIQRRQNDFNELRQNLIKVYPGAVIPSMPTDPIQKLEPEFMNERRIELQVFIDKLMVHPLLKTSRMVWDFFNVVNEEKYGKIKQESAKFPAPKEVTELITKEGYANTAIDVFLMQNCIDIQVGLKEISSEFIK